MQRIAYAMQLVSVRTAAQPSPAKPSGGSRHPGQPQNRSTIDSAIGTELADARFLSDDLADHMFGHLVSTELAKEILRQFIADGVVTIYEGNPPSNSSNDQPLVANSEGANRALEQAFEEAKYHGCQPPGTQSSIPVPSAQSTPEHSKDNSKKKSMEKPITYTWQWTDFPREPIGEDRLVAFLNVITDKSFAFAKPQLDAPNDQLRNRFAAPKDKHHAVPLAYEPDGEDMRPDFLVLPVEAFSDDFKTVDERYVNFTALRVVGESKNKDLNRGIEQVQRYARGLRRAQPWVHFVVAMTVTKGEACLLRGESSGTESLQLTLADGRGCIEFIRILLGLALSDHVDLGHNPDVELKSEARSCRVPELPRPPIPSKVAAWRPSPSSRQTPGVSSTPLETSSIPSEITNATSSTPPSVLPSSSHPTQTASTTSKSNKRTYSEHEDDTEDVVRIPLRKRKVANVERMVFVPLRIYGHICYGILFTSSSIRGRCTTVFCVVDLENPEKLLALKMSWQDIRRLDEQNEVMERLKQRGGHPNVVVPFKMLRDTKKDACTTLETIRAFRRDDLGGFAVENRILSISISELKRPVKFFWSIHDFVRGLRGAMLGHQYLTSIGILHRDVSENNMVLALFPGGVHGYIIDLDMAILQEPEEVTEPKWEVPQRDQWKKLYDISSSSPLKSDDSRPIKALRTGTAPYMSFNVLRGRKHTHFDDVESFLYVLLLFFFSYAGPLSAEELGEAHAQGFVQCIGSGRHSHMRSWPRPYALWAEDDFQRAADNKHSMFTEGDTVGALIRSPTLRECLQNNWDSALHYAIISLLGDAWQLFSESVDEFRSRTQVSQDQFIAVLDAWLEDYTSLEDQFSNCPFPRPSAPSG